jgi:hypothetical protein
VIPKIDVCRAANMMLRRYGEKTIEGSTARSDGLAAQTITVVRVWHQITDAVSGSSI